ncbi:MAG: hypothetical protein ABEK04_01485 [Candidatus Nanohalobium sp.]
MKLGKLSVLLAAVIIQVSSAAALSCVIPPAEYTFHCPESSCDQKFEAESAYEDSSKTLKPSRYNSTFSAVSYEIGTEPDNNMERLRVRKVSNSKLPSAEKALKEDKSLCPGAENIHLYPRESFQRNELRDTTICYKTTVKKTPNYYKVTRESTTEPDRCKRVYKNSMIAGGDRSWVEPRTSSDKVVNMLLKLLLVLLLL